MENALAWPRPLLVARWRDLVMPKEHGSWSLALEPLAFGLLVAPSLGGAAFAIAATAGFFARRPLRIAISDARPHRRAEAWRVLVSLGGIAAVALGASLALAGAGWLVWLLPAAVAGAAFAAFDLRNAGREEAAEVMGAAAFALLPAAFAMLGNASALTAIALATVMLGRSVPTVLTVRATIRARKTGEWRVGSALAATGLALAGIALFARSGAAPVAAAVFAGLFAVRAAGLLLYPRPELRARTIGMIEGGLGAAFVLVVGLSWAS